MYSFTNLKFDADPELDAINEILAAERLYQLASCGGDGAGDPCFKEAVSVQGEATKMVTFIVQFPLHPVAMAWMHGQKAEVPLRFQKDGSLYDGSIVKVFVRGELWEGTVHVYPVDRTWNVIWAKG